MTMTYRPLICTISTTAQYHLYTVRMLASVDKYLPCDTLVFSDATEPFYCTRQIRIPSLPWPDVTMARYRLLLEQREYLEQFTHVFWLDSDMEVIAPIALDAICALGITATQHYGHLGRGTPELNPQSACYTPSNEIYFTGSFQGGSTAEFLTLCEACDQMLNRDSVNGYVPLWHDESAVNRYLSIHPPALVLRNWHQKIAIITKPQPDRPGGFSVASPPPASPEGTLTLRDQLNESLAALTKLLLAERRRITALEERIDFYNKRTFNFIKI